MKFKRSFYNNPDVLQVAKQLIGQTLCTSIKGQLVKTKITEVEAYCGRTDEGCHAYPNKRTKRTEVLYGAGGFAYVYLCYGIHNMLNVVTNKVGLANCILIRAVEPIDGIEIMIERRGLKKAALSLSTGPGCVGQALGINLTMYGTDFLGDTIWIESADAIPESDIGSSARIGMNFDGPDKYLPWRFFIKDSLWVSKFR